MPDFSEIPSTSDQKIVTGFAAPLPREHQAKTDQIIAIILGQRPTENVSLFKKLPAIQEATLPGEVNKFVATELTGVDERYLFFDALFTARESLDKISVSPASQSVVQARATEQEKDRLTRKADRLLESILGSLPDKPPSRNSISPREEAYRAYIVHRIRTDTKGPLPAFLARADYQHKYFPLMKAVAGDLRDREIGYIVTLTDAIPETATAAGPEQITRKIKADLMEALGRSAAYVENLRAAVRYSQRDPDLRKHAKEILRYQADSDHINAAKLAATMLETGLLPYEFVTRFGNDTEALQALLAEVPTPRGENLRWYSAESEYDPQRYKKVWGERTVDLTTGASGRVAGFIENLMSFPENGPQYVENQINILAITLRAYMENIKASAPPSPDLQNEWGLLRHALFTKLPGRIPAQLFARVLEPVAAAGNFDPWLVPEMIPGLTHNADYAQMFAGHLLEVAKAPADDKTLAALAEVVYTKAKESGFISKMFIQDKDRHQALVQLASKSGKVAEAVFALRTDADFATELLERGSVPEIAGIVGALQMLDRSTTPPSDKTRQFLQELFPGDYSISGSYHRKELLGSIVRELGQAKAGITANLVEPTVLLFERLNQVDPYESAGTLDNSPTLCMEVSQKIAAGDYQLPQETRQRSAIVMSLAHFLSDVYDDPQRISKFFGRARAAGIDLPRLQRNLKEVVWEGIPRLEYFKPAILWNIAGQLGYIGADSAISVEGKSLLINALKKAVDRDHRWYDFSIKIGIRDKDHVFPPDIEAELITHFIIGERTNYAFISDASESIYPYMWESFPAEAATDPQLVSISQRLLSEGLSCVEHSCAFFDQIGAERTDNILRQVFNGNPNLISSMQTKLREAIARAQDYIYPYYQRSTVPDNKLLAILDKISPPAPPSDTQPVMEPPAV